MGKVRCAADKENSIGIDETGDMAERCFVGRSWTWDKADFDAEVFGGLSECRVRRLRQNPAHKSVRH